MTKRIAMLIGLALAGMPGGAAAQDIGASFAIRERPVQPDLVVASRPGAMVAAGRVPAGWAWSVSRGTGGGAGSPRLVSQPERADTIDAALRQSIASSEPGQPVTLTFVPI